MFFSSSSGYSRRNHGVSQPTKGAAEAPSPATVEIPEATEAASS